LSSEFFTLILMAYCALSAKAVGCLAVCFVTVRESNAAKLYYLNVPTHNHRT